MINGFVTVDRSGRVALKKETLNLLALKPGDQLKLKVWRGTITLTPVYPEGSLIRKGKALVFSNDKRVLINKMVNDVLNRCRQERHTRILSSDNIC